jgi:hypothetical protein
VVVVVVETEEVAEMVAVEVALPDTHLLVV